MRTEASETQKVLYWPKVRPKAKGPCSLMQRPLAKYIIGGGGAIVIRFFNLLEIIHQKNELVKHL